MGYAVYTNPRFPTDPLVGRFISAQASPDPLDPNEIVQLGSGALPAGLSLDATGNLLIGYATTVGDYDVTLERYNTVTLTVIDTYPYTIVVLDLDIEIDAGSGNPTTDTIFTDVSHTFSLVYTGSYTPDTPASFVWANLGSVLPAGVSATVGAGATASVSGRPREAGQHHIEIQVTDDASHVVSELFWFQNDYASPDTQDVPALVACDKYGSSVDVELLHTFSASGGYIPYGYLGHDSSNWLNTSPEAPTNALPWDEYLADLGLASGDFSVTSYLPDYFFQRFIVKDRLLQVSGDATTDKIVRHVAGEFIPRSAPDGTPNNLYYTVQDYASPTSWDLYRYADGVSNLIANFTVPGVKYLYPGDPFGSTVLCILLDALDTNFEVKAYSKTAYTLATTHSHGKGSATEIYAVVHASTYGAAPASTFIFFDDDTASGNTVVKYEQLTGTFTGVAAFASGKAYVAACATGLENINGSLIAGQASVWVLNKTDGELIKYDIFSGTITDTYPLPVGYSLDGMNAAECVTPWKDTHILITDSGQDKVYRFNILTESFDSEVTGLTKPSQIVVDQNPHHPQTYVLNQGASSIVVLDDAFAVRYTAPIRSAEYGLAFPNGGTLDVKPNLKVGSVTLSYHSDLTGLVEVTDTFDTGTSGLMGIIGTVDYATGEIIVTFPVDFIADSATISYENEPTALGFLVSEIDYRLWLIANGNVNTLKDRVDYQDIDVYAGDPTFDVPATIELAFETGETVSETYTVSPNVNYTYSLLSGTVPTGLTVTKPTDNTLLLAGTPSVPGVSVFTVKMTPPGERDAAIWIFGDGYNEPL